MLQRARRFAEKRKNRPEGRPFHREGSRTRPARGGLTCIILVMVELTQLQADLLKRLFAAGFRPIAIAPYESALCVHRGEYVAMLAPVPNGGLRLLVPATVLVDGNVSVRLKKPAGDVFVWKGKEVAATEERLEELEKFRHEIVEILSTAGGQ